MVLGGKKLHFKRPKNSQIKVGLCWCHITEAMQSGRVSDSAKGIISYRLCVAILRFYSTELEFCILIYVKGL